MPNTRLIAIFGTALVCAILASVLVVRYVRTREQEVESSRIEVQPVVVAVSDIATGTRLTDALVAVREWPKTGLPEATASSPESVVGRLTRVGIAKGEPILEHRLFPKDLATAGIMSILVPSGKRAMAIGVNEVIGVSGFILPKDRVDVIATGTGGDQRKGKLSETILQNIEVLAVGKRLEQKGEQNIEVPTVTMAVTPEQAERLARALHDGKIHIALRSIMDIQTAESPAAPPPSTRRVASAGRKKVAAQVAAAEPQEKKVLVVDVIRGDTRTRETYALQ